MAVRTGLSKSICGHIIELTRDEQAKVATVVVRPNGSVAAPTDIERAAIKSAADLLAQQARRFFGIGWTVRNWER